jgi:membrane protease YdiL (CAAX protease family)
MKSKNILLHSAWVAWIGLAILSFVCSIFAVSTLVQVLVSSGVFTGAGQTTILLVQSIAVYVLALFLLLIVAKLLGLQLSRKELGLAWLRWRDIGLAIAGFILYAVVGTLIVLGLRYIFPQLALDQAQDIGFTSVFGGERLLAFIALVIVAPIVEEILFRGLLYGKMRKSGLNVVVSTLVVSVLFAVVHGQLNVGIDVFMLSVVMCLMREYTGGIGTSIIIHMMKNALAFYVLFIATAAS